MKKPAVIFFMLCLTSIALLAGCKKGVKPDEPETPVTPDNTKPSLSIINQEGYIANGDTLQCGTSYNFGFIALSNSQTNAELSSLIILIDDEEKTNLELSDTEYTYNDSISFNNYYPIDRVTITAILSDIAGNKVSKSLQVHLQKTNPETLVGRTIEWIRKGQTVESAEEMAQYGLQWSGSYKDIMATIEPLDDDVILYLCDGDDFDDIIYWSDKYAYFNELAETADPIEKYRNINTNNDSSYNDMLAVVYGDDLFLIHITYADIKIGNYGTQITITGEAK